MRTFCLAFGLLFLCLTDPTSAEVRSSDRLVYEGMSGPGQGKHLVFLAGDHEYRSEQTLPALARILAKHHGFKCTVLFTLDRETGTIDPAANHLPGTDVLATADLAVVFLRFKDLPPEQMQPIVDYLNRGGPVVGLRTATHAFKISTEAPFAKFSYDYAGDDYSGGFGRQVLGETWADHHGENHVMSTRLDVPATSQDHPILRGVSEVWVQSGGYWTAPMPGSEVLAIAQPLQGMSPDAPVAKGKAACPGAWLRSYASQNGGARGRVFATTYGASEDLLNEGFRRLLVNASFWAVGLEKAITSTAEIGFVGPYRPTTFGFKGNQPNVRPEDLAGWVSPIGLSAGKNP